MIDRDDLIQIGADAIGAIMDEGMQPHDLAEAVVDALHVAELVEALKTATDDIDENYHRFFGRELLVRNSTIDKMRKALRKLEAVNVS